MAITNWRRAIAKKKGTESLLPEIEQRFIDYSSTHYNITRERCEEVIKPFIQIILDASGYGFSQNHSDAYSMVGYISAWLRYYYPVEFLAASLNIFADDQEKTAEIIKYASKRKISVTNPKFGLSKGNYVADPEHNRIAKGIDSIKYMNAKIADEMKELYDNNQYDHFVDLLDDIENKTSMNSRQLDILIKLDFFSEFGNQRELLRINDLFHDKFKCGDAKKISKEEVDGTPIAPIVQKYSVGVTKSGAEAKSYTLLDIHSILRECEELIKQANMPDLSDTIKVRNFYDTMGYIGYTSGKPEDRRKLYVLETYPVCRKKDGKQFGYSIITKSIGSGVDGRFTVFNNVYNKDPISKGDIIYCRDFKRDGQYFQLTSYEKVI